MSWSSLPPELRAKILENLIISKHCPFRTPFQRQRQREHDAKGQLQMSQYACVDREWQAYFEAENFKTLILTNRDLWEFGTMVTRSGRGHLVQWIWLRVILPKYGCDRCSTRESDEEKNAHEILFTTAVWNLMGFLSELKDETHPGMSLELSVNSPSDSEHHCQELRNTMRDTAWYAAGNHKPVRFPNDVAHSWNNGRRRQLPPEAYLRVFGDPQGLRINFHSIGKKEFGRFPSAKVVRELVIRLQFYRHFSVRYGLYHIIRALPQLESLVYECRQGLQDGSPDGSPASGQPISSQTFRQREHRLLLHTILLHRNSIKKLKIYEKTNCTYSRPRSPREADPGAGELLEEHSHNMHELYATNMVDAQDFLSIYWPNATREQVAQRRDWPNLQRLYLTSSLDCVVSDQNLLRAAATAASHMPNIKTLEIKGYHGRSRFLYAVVDRKQYLLVTKGMVDGVDEGTLKCWRRARQDSSDHLIVQKFREYPTIASCGSIERHSSTATTRRQERLEARMQRNGVYRLS